MNDFSLTTFSAITEDLIVLTKDDGTILFHLGGLLGNIGSKTRPAEAKAAVEERLGDGVVNVYPISDSLGRVQETNFVTEAGATWLVSRSRTEAGKALDRRIHTEILPQIRKTGAYRPNEQPMALPTPKELARMVIAAEEAREKAEAEKLALAAKIEADEAATTLGKIIESSQSRNIRIGDFAKVLGDTGQNRYFEELRECRIIMLASSLPYQQYISAGYFRVTQVLGKGAASDKWFPVALITPKGQAYLAKRHKRYLASIATERVIEAQVEALV